LRAVVVLAAPLLVITGLTAAPADAATVTARSLLAKLEMRAETASDSYDRAKFRHWVDADGDGCDTRDEVLLMESTTQVFYSGGCSISFGTWNSWYDSRLWQSPADVDIDHLVALKEAWESGAHGWGAARRTAFANDLGHPWSLEAVTDNVNASKGDRDPAQWLPSFSRCRYAIHWATVKYRWNLSIDQAERARLASLLDHRCGRRSVRLPAEGAATLTGGSGSPGSGTTPTPSPSSTSTSTPTQAPTTSPTTGGTDPRFQYCYQAIAAGYGPYYSGVDPEYDWYLDADSDGVVCET
jgi:hypothetical protein